MNFRRFLCYAAWMGFQIISQVQNAPAMENGGSTSHSTNLTPLLHPWRPYAETGLENQLPEPPQINRLAFPRSLALLGAPAERETAAASLMSTEPSLPEPPRVVRLPLPRSLILLGYPTLAFTSAVLSRPEEAELSEARIREELARLLLPSPPVPSPAVPAPPAFTNRRLSPEEITALNLHPNFLQWPAIREVRGPGKAFILGCKGVTYLNHADARAFCEGMNAHLPSRQEMAWAYFAQGGRQLRDSHYLGFDLNPTSSAASGTYWTSDEEKSLEGESLSQGHSYFHAIQYWLKMTPVGTLHSLQFAFRPVDEKTLLRFMCVAN